MRSGQQHGFGYVEVLIATLLLAVAMVPALEALQGALASSVGQQQLLDARLARVTRMEEVLNQAFSALHSEAGVHNDASAATAFSDAAGTPERIIVRLSFYDLANADADGDPFTIADPNSDSDNNPYTGTTPVIEVLWVRVEQEDGSGGLESLSTLQ